MEMSKNVLLDKVEDITSSFVRLRDSVDEFCRELEADPETSSYKDTVIDDLESLSQELDDAWDDKLHVHVNHLSADIDRLYDDALRAADNLEDDLPLI